MNSEELKKEKHDLYVKQVAKILKNQDFTDIKADLPDSPNPNGFSWAANPSRTWFSDITASKNGNRYVFEIKSTQESFAFPNVKYQLEAFDGYAKQPNKYFILVVPESVEQYAKKIVAEWGLDNCKVRTLD